MADTCTEQRVRVGRKNTAFYANDLDSIVMIASALAVKKRAEILSRCDGMMTVKELCLSMGISIELFSWHRRVLEKLPFLDFYETEHGKVFYLKDSLILLNLEMK